MKAIYMVYYGKKIIGGQVNNKSLPYKFIINSIKIWQKKPLYKIK